MLNVLEEKKCSLLLLLSAAYRLRESLKVSLKLFFTRKDFCKFDETSVN